MPVDELTVKLEELDADPTGVATLILPVVAAAGTVVEICESETMVKTAPVPLKATAVVPDNPDPPIVTAVPPDPLVGENEVICGAVRTTKAAELEPVPADVVTEISPVDAPTGTTAVNCDAEITVKDPEGVPLNATDVAPVNPDPPKVTVEPGNPELGEKDVTCGAEVDCETVNDEELVPVPLEVVTLIGPELAPDGTQVFRELSETTVKVAAIPLKRTELAPTNPVPPTEIAKPGAPLPGEKELIWGGVVGCVTEKEVGLDTVCQLVAIVIRPDVAPLGTTALIFVEETTTKLEDLSPLNDTDLTWLNPKPAIVTVVPMGPPTGENELICTAV